MRYSIVRGVRDQNPKGQEASLSELVTILQDGLEVGDKFGSGICGGTFREGGKRRKADVELMHSVILDVDHGVDDVDEFLGLWPWKGVAYTTFSHTLEEPKFRVVLPFKYPIQPNAYAVVWSWAYEHSGGRIDQQCKNTDRLYFLPRVPSEEALEEAWVRPLNKDADELDPLEQALRWQIFKGEGRNNSFYWLSCRLAEMGWAEDKIMAYLLPLQREFRNAGSKSSYTETELRDSIGSAKREATAPDTKGKKRHPNDMARQILAEHKTMQDPDGYCFEWDGQRWKRLNQEIMVHYAMGVDSHRETTSRRRNETVSYVRANAQSQEEVPWGNLNETEVPVSDGVLDVETGTLRPHKPEDYIEAVVPHSWVPDAKAPLWQEALEQWFDGVSDKQQRLSALQEFMGYALVHHARYKRALVLFGEKHDTGKSVVATVMADLIGRENTCCISVEVMHDPRQIAPIRGKALNVVSELTAQAMISDAGFKRLVSSGEPVMLDEKFEKPVLYFPHCVHVITTNVLPRCTDETRATYRRLLLIGFENQVPLEDQDPNLEWKLRTEMEGILVWAVEGARRLAANNGRFTVVPSSEERIREYREEQNPIYAFLEERCYKETGAEAEFGEVYAAFCDWYRKSVTRPIFGRWLKSAAIEIERRREPRSGMKRYLMGWRMESNGGSCYSSSRRESWNG